MADSQQRYGGYNEEFIDKVPDALVCHICANPLRDPHITKCCGHDFCESCLEQWAVKHPGEQCCPFCRSKGDEFQHFLDKKTKREIIALKVRCSYREKGCKWIGELGSLKSHINGENGCGYMLVDCTNGCRTATGETTKILRKDLTHHLESECELRDYQCQHCGEESEYFKIVNFHYNRCPEFPVQCPNKCHIGNIKRGALAEHLYSCPLEKVYCPFIDEGCDAKELLRKDEDEHMKKNVIKHQLLLLKSNLERKAKDKERDKTERKWDQTVTAIAKNLDSLLISCSDDQMLPLQSIRSLIDDSCYLKDNDASLVFHVTDFSVERNSTWYSPPFYIGGVDGLKLRLAVYPDGIETGAGTHVSLVIQKLKLDLEVQPRTTCGLLLHIKSCGQTYVPLLCSSTQSCSENIKTLQSASCYEFIPHESAKTCAYNTLEIVLTLERRAYCYDHKQEVLW